ncbi:MAG TPA: hypothetical protein VFT12_10050, partial [Thermoanaerobaculia bacterium]|nr:hypothetical protein [Thermoanaerobaculia bacterium]
MKISLYGCSLGYHRGIIRHLAELGHHITFHEPALEGVERALDDSRDANVVIKVSGGAHADILEREVLARRTAGQVVVFWDIDPPATLDRLTGNAADPFRALVPQYDLVFTYGGGSAVVTRYKNFGARECVPIYNA